MTANDGVLSKVHEIEFPEELRRKLAEVRGLVDLKEVQRVVLRIDSEVDAERINPDRFSQTNPPWYAGATRPASVISSLRIVGEVRELTEAEHKTAQLDSNLQEAYAKLLSAIEDLASVQIDVYAASS